MPGKRQRKSTHKEKQRKALFMRTLLVFWIIGDDDEITIRGVVVQLFPAAVKNQRIARLEI